MYFVFSKIKVVNDIFMQIFRALISRVFRCPESRKFSSKIILIAVFLFTEPADVILIWNTFVQRSQNDRNGFTSSWTRRHHRSTWPRPLPPRHRQPLRSLHRSLKTTTMTVRKSWRAIMWMRNRRRDTLPCRGRKRPTKMTTWKRSAATSSGCKTSWRNALESSRSSERLAAACLCCDERWSHDRSRGENCCVGGGIEPPQQQMIHDSLFQFSLMSKNVVARVSALAYS